MTKGTCLFPAMRSFGACAARITGIGSLRRMNVSRADRIAWVLPLPRSRRAIFWP